MKAKYVSRELTPMEEKMLGVMLKVYLAIEDIEGILDDTWELDQSAFSPMLVDLLEDTHIEACDAKHALHCILANLRVAVDTYGKSLDSKCG